MLQISTSAMIVVKSFLDSTSVNIMHNIILAFWNVDQLVQSVNYLCMGVFANDVLSEGPCGKQCCICMICWSRLPSLNKSELKIKNKIYWFFIFVCMYTCIFSSWKSIHFFVLLLLINKKTIMLIFRFWCISSHWYHFINLHILGFIYLFHYQYASIPYMFN